MQRGQKDNFRAALIIVVDGRLSSAPGPKTRGGRETMQRGQKIISKGSRGTSREGGGGKGRGGLARHSCCWPWLLLAMQGPKRHHEKAQPLEMTLREGK